MTQKLYTPEQVAEYLGVSSHKVACLLRSKQLGCAYVGSARRITEGHITQYLQLAASRSPRKRRPRPEIPADLAPVWARLTELAVKNHPLIAPFVQEATLERINPKARLAEVSTRSAAAATVLMAGQNRYALQRHLRSIFHRPLMLCITCSK
jgi:excisionase family DNA binding protein